MKTRKAEVCWDCQKNLPLPGDHYCKDCKVSPEVMETINTLDKPSAHTPGPLTVLGNAIGQPYPIVGHGSIGTVKQVGNAWTKADAELFAAAPELLEALRTLRLHLEYEAMRPAMKKLWKIADEAIAKAEGR